jgi:hypothetical protein
MNERGFTVPIWPATLLIVAAATFFAVIGTRTARAETPSPSPSAADATGTVYSDTLYKQRALDWRAWGVKCWYREVRARKAFKQSYRPLWAPSKELYATWREYGDANKAWAQARYRKWKWLRYRLTHPHGSPSRMPWQWAPLLRYCGMPESRMRRAIRCMGRESRGRRWAVNHPWYGLYQFSTAHWRGRWNWRNPYQQCSRFARAVRNGTVRYHWRATW